MPLFNDIIHRQCECFVIILYWHSFFLFFLVRVHCITVGIPMRRIVTNNDNPFLIFCQLTFQLNYKANDLTVLSFELNA